MLTPEVLEAVRQLEERRQVLQRAAETLSQTGINANVFENAVAVVGRYHAQVLRVYARTPFPDLFEALELLQNCVVNLKAEPEMTQRRVQAVNFCRNGARLVAEALSRPLQPPEELPVVAPPTPAPARPGRTRRAPAPAAAPTPAPSPPEAAVVAEAYAQLKERRPNVATGERALDKLEAQGVDVAEAREKLEEYQAITRNDYERGAEGAEEYKEAREEAWTEFLDSLESTEEPEAEEG